MTIHDFLFALLGLCSLVGCGACVIMVIVNLFRKESVKLFLIGIPVCFVLFMVFGSAISTPESADTTTEDVVQELTTAEVSTQELEETTTEVTTEEITAEQTEEVAPAEPLSLADIPEFDFSQVPEGEDTIYVIDQKPFGDMEIPAFSETYYVLSEFDDLGRCGTCYGVFGKETMAEGERGSIGHIRPSGWHTVKYEDIISDRYLYNRAHLLMYKLSSILDDERNLITGTRQCNLAMLEYEEQLTSYIYQNPDNHIFYCVTPHFVGNELVARGVLMRAVSIEDDTISFCVYIRNIQDGIVIDYATGESKRASEAVAEATTTEQTTEQTDEKSDEYTWICNKNTKKYHYSWCSSVKQISPKNKKEITGTKEEIEKKGYQPCKRCQ